MKKSCFDEIDTVFRTRGGSLYFGEAVTEAEHALQSAALAEAEGASPALIVAALLHDIGHLLHGHGENIAEAGVDAKHETIGHAWLSRRFGPEVSEPARMHVVAKRYLCATDAGYEAALSPASRLSLKLQGGPMTADEAAAFDRQPFAADAVRLRRWDDTAKVVGLAVPSLDHYRPLIEGLSHA